MIEVLRGISIYTREFKYNLKLAYPVMIGMLGHTFVQFIDNVMVDILSNGNIIASGSPNEVISDKDAKTQYFGDEFNIN